MLIFPLVNDTSRKIIHIDMDAFFAAEYHETEENNKLIEKIDSLIVEDHCINDEHFFDEFLEKWDRGEYHD